MTAEGWTHPAYEAIARLVGERTGLAFAPNRRGDVEGGTRRAMARAGVTDAALYVNLVETGRLPLDALVDELTVGESYFFREPAQFEFIRREVLPEIGRGHGPEHRLLAWSAGCAAGEEAYSLAIMFEEEGLGQRARLVATDISSAALARARAAAYGAWSLRGVDARLVRCYFRRVGSRLILDDRIRRRVAFEQLNLALGPYPPASTGPRGMDLILCRNVLFYFDRETIRRVARCLFDALADGGWLITGPSDPPLADDAPYETVVTRAGVFYRRSSAPVPAAEPPTPEPPAAEPPAAASALEVSPGAPEPLAEARGAFTRGEYARVEELTRGLAADAGASALRVRALANLAGSAAAEPVCADAAACHALAPELHYLHAVLLLALGRDREAAVAARRVIYLDRSLAVAHFTLGSILRRLGDLDGARRAYRNARDLCTARPADEPVPLSDGERAGQLAAAAGRALLGLVTAAAR